MILIKLTFNISILLLFLFSIETHHNIYNKEKVKDCIKYSIIHCDTKNINFRRKIKSKCNVLITHNTSIKQIKSLHICRRKN